MNEKIPNYVPNLGGVPDKLKNEGVFIHSREIARIGDIVESVVNINGGVIPKGTQLEIEDIIIEPKGNERGFEKFLKFKGIMGEFNPKNFKKVRI